MTAQPSEGDRVLRNAASFGAFVFAPLQMFLLSRALGDAGYGRWWTAFVVNEAAAILGMLAAELYVRRELPRLLGTASDDEAHSVVGSALAVVLVTGTLLVGAQLALADPIATSRGDPGLPEFLVLFAVLPLMWNVSGVFVAALNSRNVFAPVAILRGFVMPALQCGTLFVAWRTELPTRETLLLIVGNTVVGLSAVTTIYARNFSLRTTLRHVLAPRFAGRIVRFGLGLLVAAVLFTVLGKVDLYVLGNYVPPAELGMYAACLQLAAILPSTRAIFDPIAQAQIGALDGAERHAELAASLSRLTRMCAIAMVPSFVFLVSVGQPVMEGLLGYSAAPAAVPLLILATGQFLGNAAMAALLVAMNMPGRVLGAVAGLSLAVKLALLFLLVPSYGLAGAAIATAVGTIVPMHVQALLTAGRLRRNVYPSQLLLVFALGAVLGVAGHYALHELQTTFDEGHAVAVAGGASLLAFCCALPILLTADERARAREWLRRFTRG